MVVVAAMLAVVAVVEGSRDAVLVVVVADVSGVFLEPPITTATATTMSSTIAAITQFGHRL